MTRESGYPPCIVLVWKNSETGFWAARLGPVGRTATHSSCARCLTTTVSTISSATHLLHKYIARIISYYLRIIC